MCTVGGRRSAACLFFANTIAPGVDADSHFFLAAPEDRATSEMRPPGHGVAGWIGARILVRQALDRSTSWSLAHVAREQGRAGGKARARAPASGGDSDVHHRWCWLLPPPLSKSSGELGGVCSSAWTAGRPRVVEMVAVAAGWGLLTGSRRQTTKHTRH